MKKAEFFTQLHEYLEIESIATLNEITNLKALEEYDSLMIMTIIAFIDENFATKLTATQLNSITTVKDLMDLIGAGKFED
jgi:acyl carrier protein